MVSRHSPTRPRPSGGEVMAAAVPTPNTPRRFSKKTPHPTRERGAGQHTDLAFPNAPEDDERGGGA
jgi:hypothetical protein